MTSLDAWHMRHALCLGRRMLGETWPNPSVGCVIAHGAHVIAAGVTQQGGRPHGEAMALAMAGGAAKGATAYVTLEPCSHFGKTPPCADALARAEVARVVCALGDPDPRVAGRGFAMLRNCGIAVETGLMADEARLDHRGHILRIQEGRPFVQLKLALSADGYAAAAPGKRTQISSPEAMRFVHLARAMSDAIMVGIGTVLADDPLLTCRLPGLESRSPIRVVLDSHLRLPLDAQLVTTAAETSTWVIAGPDAPVVAERALRAAGVEVMRVEDDGKGRLDLGAALRLLGSRGITRVLSEGGPRIARALLEKGLVDDMVLIHAPIVLGADGVPAFAGDTRGAVLAGFTHAKTEIFGQDVCETYRKG